MKKILVVCRFNQARSIVIGALLRENFSNLEVVTAGIEATDNNPIPNSTIEICKRWNLLEYDRFSKSFESTFHRSEWDAILAADDYVYSSIKNIVGFQETFNLTEYTNLQDLIPIDPGNLDFNSFEIELSKAAVLSMLWSKSYLRQKSSTIEGLICSQDTLITSYLNSLEKTRKKIILIDTRFEIPNPDIWAKNGIKIFSFNPRVLPIKTEEKFLNGVQVLVSKFEIDRPESIFVSKAWQNSLNYLAKTNDLKLVTFMPHSSKSIFGVDSILGLNNSTLIRNLA